MPTSTLNFGLSQPLVNDPTDEDLWGGELNDDMDDIDGLLKKCLDWSISSQTSTFSVTAPTTGTSSTGSSKVLYRCNTVGGAFAANLPAAATCTGMTVGFKMQASSIALTITPNGAELIDGSATLVLSNAYQVAVLVSNGTGWSNIATRLQDLTGYALLASPAFTGTPTAPTPAAADNSTTLATTAFVQAAVVPITPATNNLKVAVKFNGAGGGSGSQTITSSRNVTSVTRSGTGVFTINFTAATSTANYWVSAIATDAAITSQGSSNTTGHCSIVTQDSAGVALGPTSVTVMVFES